MLVAHLAVEAERCKEVVWVVDTDHQATLSLWHNRREAETPLRLDAPVERIPEALEKIAAQKATFCFIDSAPTISEQNTKLLQVADLVLIPVRPSPSDLWSVAETVTKVKEAAKPFLFVITQAKTQATITAQAVAALSQHGRVAQSFISDRVGYAAAMTGGNTAPELTPKGPVATELNALWKEIKACFNESNKKGKKVTHG